MQDRGAAVVFGKAGLAVAACERERHAARRRAEANEEAGRHLGKLERNALADLDLQNDAQPTVIRARYTELVKRCHPDANGGDRSAEHKLQRVIKAYKTLQKAGMV